MKIRLRYGRDGLDVELNGQSDISVFRKKRMPIIEDPAAQLHISLENPLGTVSLREAVAGKKNACIAVSDITRPVPNRILLPPLLDSLEQAGLSRGDICLLVATGIHRAPTKEEIIEIFGEAIAARYRILCHDARDSSAITRIGHSFRGTPIEINRRYLESDVKIVTGLVEPHFMAGYSGGRKSIAVGLTSIEAIKHLHGTELLEHPDARNCELAGNPLHTELTEIAIATGTTFCVNAVIDEERRVGGIFCGDIVQAHDAACKFAERYCVVDVETVFDIVVTTAAGYPLDTTYYQAIKGLVGALGILAPGGQIILASECSRGLGSSEFRFLLQELRRIKDYDSLIKHISEPDNFVIDQWEVEMLVKALRRAEVYLFSTGISESDWPLTHTRRVASVEEALSLAVAKSGRNCKVAVIPEGPYVIPLNKKLVKELAAGYMQSPKH